MLQYDKEKEQNDENGVLSNENIGKPTWMRMEQYTKHTPKFFHHKRTTTFSIIFSSRISIV
jgi:hypothetical protein